MAEDADCTDLSDAEKAIFEPSIRVRVRTTASRSVNPSVRILNS